MASIFPPTCHLPPVRHVGSYPINDLSKALTYLRRIYIPEVRGSRLRRSESAPSQCPSSEDLEGLDELRSDTFERSYAIKWLTTLISQSEQWSSDADTDADSKTREVLIQTAAALLAICSGTAAAGVLTRDFIFTPHSSTLSSSPIKVHIRDVPLDNSDYGSVGAQTWGGACILAEMIVDNASAFNLLPANTPTRVLELGAGTGLVSITIAKLLASSTPSPPVIDIVATDYYPSVLANLSHNILSNFPFSAPSTSISLSSHSLDWSLFPSLPTPPLELSTPFDLILGADIIYEPHHALWIKSCLTQLLRKPSGPKSPMFHLVIPLRSTHSSESQTVETVFGTTRTAVDTSNLDLRIISRETIICDARDGSAQDHVEYAYYRIGWCYN